MNCRLVVPGNHILKAVIGQLGLDRFASPVILTASAFPARILAHLKGLRLGPAIIEAWTKRVLCHNGSVSARLSVMTKHTLDGPTKWGSCNYVGPARSLDFKFPRPDHELTAITPQIDCNAGNKTNSDAAL
jgi:hypothetical protein